MEDTELRSTLQGIVQILNTHTEHFDTIFKRFDSLEMRVTRLEETTVKRDEFHNALKNLATKDEVDKLALLLAQTRHIVVDTREDVNRIEAKIDATREDVVRIDATLNATREDVKTLGTRIDFYVQKSLVHEKDITSIKRRVSL